MEKLKTIDNFYAWCAISRDGDGDLEERPLMHGVIALTGPTLLNVEGFRPTVEKMVKKRGRGDEPYIVEFTRTKVIFDAKDK